MLVCGGGEKRIDSRPSALVYLLSQKLERGARALYAKQERSFPRRADSFLLSLVLFSERERVVPSRAAILMWSFGVHADQHQPQDQHITQPCLTFG